MILLELIANADQNCSFGSFFIDLPREIRIFDPAWHQIVLNYASDCVPQKKQAIEFLKFLSEKQPSLWSYESPLKTNAICFLYPGVYEGDLDKLQSLIDTANSFIPATIKITNKNIKPIGGIYMHPVDKEEKKIIWLKYIMKNYYWDNYSENSCRRSINDSLLNNSIHEYGYKVENEKELFTGDFIKYDVTSNFDLQLNQVTVYSDLIHKVLCRNIFTENENSNEELVRIISGYSPCAKHFEQNNDHIHIYPLVGKENLICGFIIWYHKKFSAKIKNFLNRKINISCYYGTYSLTPINYALFIENIPFFSLFADTAGKSRIWRSLTPFVPPRHIKNKGNDTVKGQILRELRNFGIEENVEEIHISKLKNNNTILYRGIRKPMQYVKFHVKIIFKKEIYGPLMLGYGSHYGIGLFINKPLI
jgi:hypothetical protein